jgi:biopolymer transport protein ExbD
MQFILLLLVFFFFTFGLFRGPSYSSNGPRRYIEMHEPISENDTVMVTVDRKNNLFVNNLPVSLSVFDGMIKHKTDDRRDTAGDLIVIFKIKANQIDKIYEAMEVVGKRKAKGVVSIVH